MLKDSESLTAKICLYARANHSICDKDKIFNDFLAFNLIGDSEYKSIGKMIEKISYPLNSSDFLNKYFYPCCPSEDVIYRG